MMRITVIPQELQVHSLLVFAAIKRIVAFYLFTEWETEAEKLSDLLKVMQLVEVCARPTPGAPRGIQQRLCPLLVAPFVKYPSRGKTQILDIVNGLGRLKRYTK